jgi:hypothetical protein
MEMLKLDALVELRNEINQLIQDYKDGYFYICEVRSYGRNWKERDVHNTYTLQELCYQYYGDDGIVDVYSNNPDLSRLDNYGDVCFIPTEEDYETWKHYSYLKNSIPRLEEELDAWDNRENVSFRSRPLFAPIYSREDLEKQKLDLKHYECLLAEGSFVEPFRVQRVYDED